MREPDEAIRMAVEALERAEYHVACRYDETRIPSAAGALNDIRKALAALRALAEQPPVARQHWPFPSGGRIICGLCGRVNFPLGSPCVGEGPMLAEMRGAGRRESGGAA